LIEANQAELPVATMCKVLKVSKSGFYDWRIRPPSARSMANVVLTEKIRAIHKMSHESYGMPRVREELLELGVRAARTRIARLMRAAGIQGASGRYPRRFVITTQQDKTHDMRTDLVNRNFVATSVNQLWVGDITYVPTWAGFVYLAVVLDAYSRKVVGWAIADHIRTELVLMALNMALETRRPDDVIHHSDRGSQYTAIAFGKRCEEMGVRPSMGSVGDAYDNAMAESFFGSLERELLSRRTFKTKAEAKSALFTYIEAWYNPKRRHSGIGYKSPNNFERSQLNFTQTHQTEPFEIHH
jgi:putative transposase